MPAEGYKRGVNRGRLRAWRRRVMAVLPLTVWVLAIVGALHLYRRLGAAPAVTGYAQDAPVILAHLEPGVVRSVQVQIYERVTRGQILLTMDDAQERIRLAAIEQDIERLRAEVSAERARVLADNVRATADYVDLARRFAVDREAAHIEYLFQLAQDARDRMLLRGELVEYDIVRDLYERNEAAFRELNDMQTRVDSLRALIAKNAEVLERQKKAFEETDRRWRDYFEHEAVALSYEPVLTPLRLAVEVRERDLDEVLRQIDTHVYRSPIEGQVTDLAVHAGDHVQPGLALVTISPTSTNKVEAFLPERVVLSARVGTPVKVRCLATAEGRRRQYTGTVVSLSATVTESPPRYRPIPTYPVWGRGLVVALGEEARLIPGESVSISFLK